MISKFPDPPNPKKPSKSSPAIESLLMKYVPFIKVAAEELARRFVPVEHFPVQFIGVMKVTGGEVPGCVLSTRAGGEELLFAGRDGRPLAWIPVGAFVLEPAAIATVEDIRPVPKPDLG